MTCIPHLFFFCGATAQLGPRQPRTQLDKNTHAHTMGLPLLRDQLIAEPDTYIIHNKHKRKMSGFEPSIQATADLRLRPSTGIGIPHL